MAETKTEVKTLGYMVDGEWRESKSDTWVDITNSNTGEVIARTPMCTQEEVTEAIESANRAYPAWASMPIQKRTEILFTWRPKLIERMDEIATLVSTELGKSLDEARGEVIKIIEAIDIAVGAPMVLKGESLMNVSTGHDTVTYREPLGVFAGIAPFNFPAMIPFGWMLPLCISTGNTFVLKAANPVPLTSHLLLDMLYEAGLPKGVVNMVTAEKEQAEVLLKHPAVRGVSFVGTTPVGKHVFGIAASHGKRVQAQTQAKNHGLVLKDASLERAARGIINSTFGCAGMRCMALPVICVENAVADEFVALMKKFAQERVVGNATDPKTELGPVVSAQHKRSVTGWIEKAIAEGAELVLDGRDINDQLPADLQGGHFVGPTIFDHVTEEMECGREEAFGPVLFIKRVDDFEAGLEIMNSNPYANGSCIFTESGYYSREFARRTHAGMVGINVGIPVPVSFFPFSGHKDSFFGDLHVLGEDGVRFFTETKTVTTRWFTEADKKQKQISTWEGTVNR
jgi:malonate-semialdehyde dehydrogenase (acetylating) / methylmalonate-semialdehyde dehydrogenase